MRRIADAIGRRIPGARVNTGVVAAENRVNRLIVSTGGVQIKIEVTPVMRGCVNQPAVKPVSARVEDEFGYAEIQVVSFPDLYVGKIVAALGRQLPGDFFDVWDLLANEGIGEGLRKAFIVYLVSHNRPMAEVLAPARLDIAAEFARGFEGMTEASVTLDELLRAREALITEIMGGMPENHRHFPMSAKRGEPSWALLGVPGAEALPSVRWRTRELGKAGKVEARYPTGTTRRGARNSRLAPSFLRPQRVNERERSENYTNYRRRKLLIPSFIRIQPARQAVAVRLVRN